MRQIRGLLVIIGLVGIALIWQLVGQGSDAPRPEEWTFAPPDPDAVAVKTDIRLSGVYPVGSRLPDHKALGGFGGCDNFPINVGDHAWGEKGKLSLVVDPGEAIGISNSAAWPSAAGQPLRRGERIHGMRFAFYLVQEAQDEQGKSCEIEELPQS